MTSETIDPTCTEYGYILYAATVTFDGVIWGRYFRDAEVPATGHSYGEPVFTWASDYQSATASAACSSCGEELTAECQISGEVTAPSCTEDGSITYTATAVIDGTEYTDTRTGSGEPATGHAYLYTDNGDGTHTAVCYRGDGSFTEEHDYLDDGACSLCGSGEHVHSYTEPVFSWSWSDDYTEVTAVFTCSCGDEQELPCDVSAETTAPTCTEEGYILYTATVTFDGVTYTDTATEAGASATGHSYLYIDNGDGTHTGSCSICGDKVDGSHTYTDGSCVSCGAVEDSHVHVYGTPEFTWSDDYTSCKAVFTCEDGDDTREVECTVTSETAEAACTAAGSTTYTAAAEFGGQTYTGQTTVAGDPATGHSYGEPVFTWESDYQSATASAACNICGEELTAVCQISGEVTAPSCTEDGSITYTATAVIDGTEYTDTRTGSGKPATGHIYLYTDNGDGTHTAVCYRGDGSFTEDHVYVDDGTCSLCGFEEHVHSYGKPMFSWSWSDTYTEVTAVFTCSCGDEQEIPCDVAAETTAPTCTEEGYILYTATVTFDGVTYTDTATEAGASATGHSYLYIDNGDGTHTGTCSICRDEVDESHTYADGICVSCGAAEASHDHVYGDPEFTWSDDYSSCTAVFTCVYGDDIQKLECEVTSVDNGDGTITYNATVAFNGITYENALAEGETGETSDDSSGSGDDSTGEGSGGNGDTTADSTDSDSNGSISDDGGSQASGSDDADDQSSDSSSPASSGDSVQTGDDSNIAIWAGLAAAAGMLTILIGIRRKRRAY